MRTVILLIAALGLTACQTKSEPPIRVVPPVAAAAPAPVEEDIAPVTAVSHEERLNACNLKIDELKHYDKKRANAARYALSRAMKAKADTQASAAHISPEALNYALYHQDQSVEVICTQVSQRLDRLILNKVMKTSA
ncbi:hypothetical protein PYW49_18880 [Enterobacter sp. 170198]|jgi:hypothetical protein|uniref:Lipoprotein n=1 Tax=Enterobacter chinensis TaxID=3030997 RepID=A0ABU5D6V6_9ENTR|nr:hypothetical protein [Enterobacter sp. 170198]MDY0419716.1 hypothetical protein [Enterobacter sp. 170198]